MNSLQIKNYINIGLKVLFIMVSILFILPSIIYLIKNGTINGFKIYYNFFINANVNKNISTIIYLIIFITLTIMYLYFLNKQNCFKDIKSFLIYTSIISTIFLFMTPWTSSDIFYYMGVGELNSVYGQNPYYTTIKEYCDIHKPELENDTIIKQGYRNYWANTTVVYGPIAQLFFSSITKISFKNVDICLVLFKLVNVIMHLLNCYLIYKITKKLKFTIMYGLNLYILLEFIANVHNDIIVIFFILLALYFLLKKKNLLISILFLAIATGIKYFTVLLLPVIILYYFKDEKNIFKRLLKCIQYGLIFIGIILLEYAIYFKDVSIFTAMMVQNKKFSKSVYSGIIGLSKLNKVEKINIFKKEFEIKNISILLRNTVFVIFALIYIKFCIDLLTTKNIKIYKCLKKYSFILSIFLITLATFQQWYILWLFATIFWQKPNTIKNIIGFSFATEIANSIYMFKTESFMYDIYFWGIIICTYLIWMICTNKKGENKFGKAIINRWK